MTTYVLGALKSMSKRKDDHGDDSEGFSDVEDSARKFIKSVIRVPGSDFPEERKDGKVARYYYGYIDGVDKDQRGVPRGDCRVLIKYPPDRKTYFDNLSMIMHLIQDELDWENLPEVEYIDEEGAPERESDESEEKEEKVEERPRMVESEESDTSESDEPEDDDGDDLEFKDVEEWTGPIRDTYHLSSEPRNLNGLGNSMTPLQFFVLFFGVDLVTNIAHQSNIYKQQAGAGERVRDIRVYELYAFFGIIMYMAHLKLPQQDDYFDERRPTCAEFPDLTKVMSRHRYYEIKRYLHFANNLNDHPVGHPEHNPNFKIRLFTDHLNERFRHYWQEGKFQAVDEKLVPYKGHTKHRRRIANKPKKTGIRFYMKCDSVRFFCSFLVVDVSEGLSMPQLFERIPFHIGQVVFTDRYYTTFALAKSLMDRGVGFIGTTQTNRIPCKELVRTFTNREERGNYRAVEGDGGDVAFVAWKDIKPVFLTCTYGTLEEITVERMLHSGEVIDVSAPLVVKHFNNFMGGVDVNDHLAADYYSIINDQRCKKWTLKCFFAMIDVAVANSWIMYRVFHPEAEKRIFYRELYKSLLSYDPLAEVQAGVVDVENECTYPSKLAKSEGGRQMEGICRHCGPGHYTTFGCRKCGVGLHPGCFKVWHDNGKKIVGRVKRLKFVEE